MDHKTKGKSFLLYILMISVVFFIGCVSEEWTPSYDVPYTVDVIKVIDGDTISVILPNGEGGTIRFLGVDAPELSVDANNPFEYEDITDMVCLTDHGIAAKEYVNTMILDKEVHLMFDASAGCKDSFDRWLAYIYLINGTDINELLLEKGYVRVYTAQTFLKKETYLLLQDEAIRNENGLWGCVQNRSSGLYISYVHYDAQGDDRNNLNDEYVKIVYTSNETDPDFIDLSGYILRDANGNEFYFPNDLIILNGQNIVIYTGLGENTNTALFWNNSSPIWNNENDKAYLIDNTGNILDIYQWG